MKAQFIFEWNIFTRNIKNRLVFIIFIAATFVYGLFVAPQYVPLNEYEDETVITERIEEYQYILDTYEEADRPRTVEAARYILQFSEDQLEGLKRGDWLHYFEATSNVQQNVRYAQYGADNVSPEFFNYDEQYPEEEQLFWTSYERERYYAYGYDLGDHVTPEVVEERTVLQTIQRLLTTAFPFVLMSMVLFYAIDSVTEDNRHPTLLNSIPIRYEKFLAVKTAVVFVGFLLTILSGFLILCLTVGSRYGIGSLSIPVPQYEFNTYGGEFGMISMGLWMTQALSLFLMIALIIIRLTTWLRILFKQAFLNLGAIFPLFFIETLYYSRGIGFFSSIWRVPATFFNIGSVLIGYQNHLYATGGINFGSGMVSLGVIWLIIEMMLFVTTRFEFFRKAIV